jgi:hypothetical protein
MSNWRSLPISERYNTWKLYREAYPEMSHRDMVKHFDNYQDGGIIDGDHPLFKSDKGAYADSVLVANKDKEWVNDPPGPLGKYITMYNKAVKTLGTDNPEVLKNFFASQQYGQNNTQVQQNNNINKAPQPKESKIGNVAGDIGTLALSTLQNFGMNIPGDVIKTVAPKAAILDLLPQTTTNQYVKQRNQSLGQNIKDVADAANTVAAFEMGTPLVAKGIQAGFKYASPYVKPIVNSDKNRLFKSEINWAKWNKEIPENTQLINEYNAIEQTSKANGTWMKNPDGSPFQGTPEQFVQQNSENFKKAFPNVIRDEYGNVQKTYHGSQNTFDYFDPNIMMTGRTRGQGIYTSPFRERAASYATKGDKKVYEFYQNANKPQDIVQQFNKASEQRFKEFLEKNPKGSKDFDKKFNEFMKKEDELFNLTDEDFNLQKGYDFLKASPDEFVVPFSNYPKSAIGNNGMFDMTNPNIYKSIIPSIIGSSLLYKSNKK